MCLNKLNVLIIIIICIIYSIMSFNIDAEASCVVLAVYEKLKNSGHVLSVVDITLKRDKDIIDEIVHEISVRSAQNRLLNDLICARIKCEINLNIIMYDSAIMDYIDGNRLREPDYNSFENVYNLYIKVMSLYNFISIHRYEIEHVLIVGQPTAARMDRGNSVEKYQLWFNAEIMMLNEEIDIIMDSQESVWEDLFLCKLKLIVDRISMIFFTFMKNQKHLYPQYHREEAEYFIINGYGQLNHGVTLYIENSPDGEQTIFGKLGRISDSDISRSGKFNDNMFIRTNGKFQKTLRMPNEEYSTIITKTDKHSLTKICFNDNIGYMLSRDWTINGGLQFMVIDATKGELSKTKAKLIRDSIAQIKEFVKRIGGSVDSAGIISRGSTLIMIDCVMFKVFTYMVSWNISVCKQNRDRTMTHYHYDNLGDVIV